MRYPKWIWNCEYYQETTGRFFAILLSVKLRIAIQVPSQAIHYITNAERF